MGVIVATPLSCRSCSDPVPTSRYPAAFCSDDCLLAYWGPNTTVDCNGCGADTIACASTSNIVTRTRCCPYCNHDI